MRVTIGHREEAGGVTGQRRTYYIDCSVEFSEEERAIIRARDLYDHDIVVRAATPLPTEAAVKGITLMRVFGGLFLLFGPIVGCSSGLAKAAEGEALGILMFLGGLAMVIFGKRRAGEQERRIVQPEQSVKVRQLLADRRFTVHAVDPARAKLLDEDIRAKLVQLKELIKGSAELQTAQTFEL